MIELSQALRDSLVEALEEFIDQQDGNLDSESIAQFMVDTLEELAAKVEDIPPEDLIAQFESTGQLDASLYEVLEDTLASSRETEFTSDQLVLILEKLCEIDWVANDDADDFGFDDDIGGGFFDANEESSY